MKGGSMGAIALACEGSVNFFGDQIARLCLDRIQTVLKNCAENNE